MSTPLPEGPFDLILADPPWAYQNMGRLQGVAGDQYPTMSLEDIQALPVTECAAEDAVLVLWATWPKIIDAMYLLPAWDFTFKTAFPWLKTRSDGLKPLTGLGFWVRGCSEPVLIATRGKPRVPAEAPLGLVWDGKPPEPEQLILTAPRGRHSQKPPEVHKLCEKLCPGGRYLELFARRPVEGWTVWGNEV